MRLPDESEFSKLMSQPGASPWKAGPMTVAHWVLVPAGLHEKPVQFRMWLEKAYRLNENLAPKKAGKKAAGGSRGTTGKSQTQGRSVTKAGVSAKPKRTKSRASKSK